MSSVSAVGGTPYDTQSTQSPWSGVRKGFQGLENALSNGDASGAQSALASLQQAIGSTQAPSSSILGQLGSSSSPLGQDLQAVQSALGSNDIGSAQKAFAKLQQDVESARQSQGTQGHHHHHHHHSTEQSASSGSASSTSVSSAGSIVNTQA